jgi:hypothetical protein
MDRAHIVPLGPSANFQGMAGLPLITAGLTLWGLYTVEILDEFGKVIDFVTAKNDVTNEGLNNILDVQFHAVTQVTTWYIGLIDASGFSDLADSDTLASHAGWTEFTNYTGEPAGVDRGRRRWWRHDELHDRRLRDPGLWDHRRDVPGVGGQRNGRQALVDGALRRGRRLRLGFSDAQGDLHDQRHPVLGGYHGLPYRLGT